MKNQKKNLPGALTEKLPSGFTFDMIHVEGGAFQMGGDDDDAYYDEHPVHEVKLNRFYMGEYPVVQALWAAVMEEDPPDAEPSHYEHPVEMVSWEDAGAFIQKLNEITGKAYRLPTEAEWEYAARGGQQGNGYLYAGSNNLDEVAWYVRNSNGEEKAVGRKKPNELGLYGMSGNVLEWCQDWYSGGYYEECQKKGVVENPMGPAKGTFHVLRGGSWYLEAQHCRCTYRHYNPPGSRFTDMGFRLALSTD